MPDWMPSWGTTAPDFDRDVPAHPHSQRAVHLALLEVRNQRFQTKMQAREKFQGAADGWDDNASAGLT